MRTIKEIWEELHQHPDVVTVTLWTKQDVIKQLEDLYDDEDFNRISDIIVDENKERFASTIRNFEGSAYDYNSWTDELDWVEKEKNKIFADDSENYDNALKDFVKSNPFLNGEYLVESNN
jgi:hypothetical protein